MTEYFFPFFPCNALDIITARAIIVPTPRNCPIVWNRVRHIRRPSGMKSLVYSTLFFESLRMCGCGAWIPRVLLTQTAWRSYLGSLLPPPLSRR